jgi:hypothetical protein
MISGFEAYRHPWAMNVAALPMPGASRLAISSGDDMSMGNPTFETLY